VPGCPPPGTAAATPRLMSAVRHGCYRRPRKTRLYG
jgi:hypothetical protein